MHIQANTISPFQRKFNCRPGRQFKAAHQPRPALAANAVASQSSAQRLAAAALALAFAAVLLAGLPGEVRAQTLSPQPLDHSSLVRVLHPHPMMAFGRAERPRT